AVDVSERHAPAQIVEQLFEARAFVLELPAQRTRAHLEAPRDLFDARAAVRQLGRDEIADLLRERGRMRQVREQQLAVFAQQLVQLRIGFDLRRFHVLARQHEAVPRRGKTHALLSEGALVLLRARGARVREPDLVVLPGSGRDALPRYHVTGGTLE